TFKIRYKSFGHTDPVNWFCVMIFWPQLFDALRAHRRAIERAVESSDGKHKGTQTATYLREVEPQFDANAGSSIGEAADSYDHVVAAVTYLEDRCKDGDVDLNQAARILSEAFDVERIALVHLKESLLVQ
ncbi:MAG TPA: hypothetical protein DIU35_17865, partial [Candidatus Latescibacteria bacterium]|nr:hypothetical protein [Candidatus Latescibacterota bacterium]